MANDPKPKRCAWCGDDPLYVEYHDNEWGKPVTDDQKLFEFLVLEGAQAGLSWITILRRREGYRKAFSDFDYKKVALYNEEDVERLMNDPGIIRNRLKINSTIKNAQLYMQILEEYGGFDNYIMSFFPDGKRIVNHPVNMEDVPPKTAISDAISKDMKKRGFKFFGSTICYAFLQAAGYIDDHFVGCHSKSES